ncbi:uncharacterized protein LOC118193284 isoform X2 [Stegodyphus dumicola]|uniref:uncharacterized protein LOC118193284 isoform X2 n=1 Tax=Stegodyphus dumicola TaxID=202533 RepID=UPI0015AB4013|nr:uncharacterized protein LOC118193284 isoform X2 [Stegodyphus dumicola]
MRSFLLLILLFYQYFVFCKSPSLSSYADEYEDKKQTELNKKNENSDEIEIPKKEISKILFTVETKRKNKNLTRNKVPQPNYSEYLYVSDFTPRNLPRSSNKRKFQKLLHVDRHLKSLLRRKTTKSIETKINEKNPASSTLITSCNTEDCERESDYFNFGNDSEKKEKSITNSENKSFTSTPSSLSEKQHINHRIPNVTVNNKNNFIPRLKDRYSVSLPFAIIEKNHASLVLISTENVDKNFFAASVNFALDADALTTKKDGLKSIRNITKKNKNSFIVSIENNASTDNDYQQYTDPVVTEDMNDFVSELTNEDLISKPGMPKTKEYGSNLISTFTRNEDTSVLSYIKDETFIRKPAVTLKTKHGPHTFPTVIQNSDYSLNTEDEYFIRKRVLTPKEKYTFDIFPFVTEDTKDSSIFEAENDNFFEISSAAAVKEYKEDLMSSIADNTKGSYIFKAEKENAFRFAKTTNHTENIQKRKTTKNNSLDLSDILNGNDDLNYFIKLYLKKKMDVEKSLLFFKSQNKNTNNRNRTVNFNFNISRKRPETKYIATNFPHLKDNDIEARIFLLNLTNPRNGIFDLKVSTHVPKTIISETPSFNLSEILILIKREHNIQRKILYKLFLYVPVLYCNVLLTIACWKLLRHIHRQMTLKNQARQIQGRIWYPPSSPPLKVVNYFSSVERRRYSDNES